jgi:hypothetical protein
MALAGMQLLPYIIDPSNIWRRHALQLCSRNPHLYQLRSEADHIRMGQQMGQFSVKISPLHVLIRRLSPHSSL